MVYFKVPGSDQTDSLYVEYRLTAICSYADIPCEELNMAWLPIHHAQLRIGLYVKVDHSWLEHPFVRNTFTISSPSEIAIIQKNQLFKLFYDPDRSHADALAAMETPVPEPSAELQKELAQDTEEDEKAMRKEKVIHIQYVMDHQKALAEAELQYADKTKQCSVMMAMVTVGQAEGVQLATQMTSVMMGLLEQPSVGVALVQTKKLDDSGQEAAANAMNVSALAILTGKLMMLNEQQLQHLSLGALFHNLGWQRVPLTIRAKRTDLSPSEARFLRLYPQFGKEILEGTSGVVREIVEIVHQHREYLDGSGYPKGLINGDISQLSRIVGVVREYNQLTSDRHAVGNMSPAQALSHLYVNMKPKLGADVIDPFIATMTVYPPGSLVEMSDNSVGLVVKTNPQERMRPIVMLYDPSSTHAEATVIDLTRERSLTIRKSLDPKSVPPTIVEMLNPSQVVGYMLLAG